MSREGILFPGKVLKGVSMSLNKGIKEVPCLDKEIKKVTLSGEGDRGGSFIWRRG